MRETENTSYPQELMESRRVEHTHTVGFQVEDHTQNANGIQSS